MYKHSDSSITEKQPQMVKWKCHAKFVMQELCFQTGSNIPEQATGNVEKNDVNIAPIQTA